MIKQKTFYISMSFVHLFCEELNSVCSTSISYTWLLDLVWGSITTFEVKMVLKTKQENTG